MARNAKVFVVEKLEFNNAPAGAIEIITSPRLTVGGINHACPCGCGKVSYMGIDPDYNTQHATWKVESGNFRELDTLTLSPSIGIGPKNDQGKYHWHGFLHNGVFIEE